MNDRLPRITPEPLPPEREALLRLLGGLTDALRLVHGRDRRTKPGNIDPDWLAREDAPEDDEAEEDVDDGEN